MRSGLNIRLRYLFAAALFCALPGDLPSQSFNFTTLAGNAGYGTEDGQGTTARFNYPLGITIDPFGNIYVADNRNCTLRKIDIQGNVTTVAGVAGEPGSADSSNAPATFAYPEGLAADSTGNVYVADTGNDTIRMVTPGGVVATIAGTPRTVGSTNGIGSQALFNLPAALTVDSTGTIFVADTLNSSIRMITGSGSSWVTTTIAGVPGSNTNFDGTNSAARFFYPSGIVGDSQQNLYVSDTGNNAIRRISPIGTNWVTTTLRISPITNLTAITTVSNIAIFDSKTLSVVTNTTTNITVVETVVAFRQPGGLSRDGEGNLYVALPVYDTICKLTPAGTNWIAITLAGNSGVPGSRDGDKMSFTNSYGLGGTNGITNVTVTLTSESKGEFNYPFGIASTANGTLSVADSLNNTVRQVDPGGNVTTLAGAAGGAGFADGVASAARFNAPLGLGLDRAGNAYIADSANNAIRRVTPAGQVTTLAGSPDGAAGTSDGVGTNAAFNAPGAVLVDANTNIYVADTGNNTIRVLSPAGGNWQVTTLAGRAGAVYYGSVTNFAGTITNSLDGLSAVFTVFSGASNYIDYIGVITNGSGKSATPHLVVTNTPFFTNIVGGVTNIIVLTATNFSLTNISVATVFSQSATFQNYSGYFTNIIGNQTNVSIIITNTPVLYSGFVTNVAGGVTTIQFVVTNVPYLTFSNSTTGLVTNRLGTNLFTANVFNLPPAPSLLDGTGMNALFDRPTSLAFAADGTVYIGDGGTNGIRDLSSQGVVSTLPGSGGSYQVSASQFGTNRLYYSSTAIQLDSSGDIFIADAANNTIRILSPGGIARTIAGSPGLYGTADGTNATVRFASPFSIALDEQTNMYIADSQSHTIRELSRIGTNWVASTIGGQTGVPGTSDGLGTNSLFNGPAGIAVDSQGILYVSDTGNNTIRVGRPANQKVQPMVIQIACPSPDTVVISWPASTGFVLETTTSLTSPAWTPVGATPVQSGNQMFVTNGYTQASAFYRLRH